MKLTLLEIVQDILSDSDSDLVNSINDTPEAGQVAQIVRTTYRDIISNRNWPHLRTLSQLTPATLAKPTHCALPNNIKELEEIRYDVAKAGEKRTYRKVVYKYPEEFLDMVNARNTDNDYVIEVLDDSGVYINIINNKAPQYWTSFDDKVVVMDSYDSEVDTHLQNTKTSCIIIKQPSWEHDDDFVPDLPSEAFSLLVAESKSRAFLALSQEPNEKAEQQAYRSRVWLSRKAWEANGTQRYPNYGRRGRK